MPDALINRTPAGWPYLDEDNYLEVIDNYTLELATKLQNSDADVAAAINAATRAEQAAATAVAAAARLNHGAAVATHAGPLAPGATAVVDIAFSAGFTAAPKLFGTPQPTGNANVADLVVTTLNVNATSAQLRVTNKSSITWNSLSVHWFAIQ